MTDHAHTLLILTDAESRWFRKELEDRAGTAKIAREMLAVFNTGIVRGTARVKAEFDAIQKAKRK